MQVSGFLGQTCFCHLTTLSAELNGECKTTFFFLIGIELLRKSIVLKDLRIFFAAFASLLYTEELCV